MVDGSRRCRDEVRALSGYVTSIVQSSGLPILWALRPVGDGSCVKFSPLQVSKYLTTQALKANAESFRDQISDQLNATRVATASTEEHWMQLLRHALAGLPEIYVVVDLDLFENEADVKDFLKVCRSCLGASNFVIKLAVFCCHRAKSDVCSHADLLLHVDERIIDSKLTALLYGGRPPSVKGGLCGKGVMAFRNLLKPWKSG
jgi:hypothetical protein